MRVRRTPQRKRAANKCKPQGQVPRPRVGGARLGEPTSQAEARPGSSLAWGQSSAKHPELTGLGVSRREFRGTFGPARSRRRSLPPAQLFAGVAEERDGIAAEPPVDVERRASRWELDRTFVAVVGREVIGELHIDPTPFGFGEVAMMVAAGWRGRGVGTALLVGRNRMGARAGSAQAEPWRVPQ